MSFDYIESALVASTIDAKKRECFKNCVIALLVNAVASEFIYVEGFALSAGQVFEHGWLENDDGLIVDPTLVLYNGDHTSAQYFPVYRFTREEIERKRQATNKNKPFMTPLEIDKMRRMRDRESLHYQQWIAANRAAGIPIGLLKANA
jgi:hypothetical protein